MNLRSSIFILILFCTIPSFSQEKDIRISGEFKGYSFLEFVTEVEKQHDIKFFFNPDWIEKVTIDNNYTDTPLTSILNSTLLNSNIKFFLDDNGYVILSGEFSIARSIQSGMLAGAL